MEIVEINTGFQINIGAPEPIIISNDNELIIGFYANFNNKSNIPQNNNSIFESTIISLKFKTFLKYTFGLPGTETIEGHPYSKMGMKSYSFYELKNSDLIKSLQNIEKIHPNYDATRWKIYKHYILTFHDNMFECIAQSFEISENYTSLYNQSAMILR